MNDAPQFATYPSLRDRLVLITGGASGIGASMVEAFMAQGARVVFLDIDQEAASSLLDRLVAPGAEALAFFPCDLTDTQALQITVEEILDRFGPVDVLVNNAANDTRHSIEEVTPESWDRGISINLKQQFFMAQAVLPGMRAKRNGSIINLSSIAWMIPSTGLPVYATAKAAIVGMTRTLAHEVGADNVRVNAVLPGAILTERQRRLWLTDKYRAEIQSRQALKRLLQPEDVARLVLFLASEDSSAITNQSYVVDGGWV